WNGMTLAINVADEGSVDAVFRRAKHAGAAQVAPPQPRAWGGYSAYIADSEDQRWEIAWAP
ncbi:MAG: glyoxalase, partial [Actinomycetota bacterium]